MSNEVKEREGEPDIDAIALDHHEHFQENAFRRDVETEIERRQAFEIEKTYRWGQEWTRALLKEFCVRQKTEIGAIPMVEMVEILTRYYDSLDHEMIANLLKR